MEFLDKMTKKIRTNLNSEEELHLQLVAPIIYRRSAAQLVDQPMEAFLVAYKQPKQLSTLNPQWSRSQSPKSSTHSEAKGSASVECDI